MNFISKAISSTCLEYSFGSSINQITNTIVLNIYTQLPKLINLKHLGIIDIVPSYTSLALYYTTASPLFEDIHAFDRIIKEASKQQSTANPTVHEVYVHYNGEDLDEVCQTLGLSTQDFIDLHASSYSIAMIGFREYFPYLLGLDKKLYLPRRDAPRARVLKGSVAIAAGQTGIYPEDSPGGWHIIGHTNFDDFKSLKPSDTIIFKNKDLHENQL